MSVSFGSEDAVSKGGFTAERRRMLPLEQPGPEWYAVYTSANHEKRVAQQLTMRHLENFVPLYESVRRWKDRRVTLQLPLFPGYLFVRMLLSERVRVIQVPGVACLVAFGGMPPPVPDPEIVALRRITANGMGVVPYPFLSAGRHVRVKSGPMAGLEGILVKRKSRMRFVLSVHLIKRAVAVEIDEIDLEPVHSNKSNWAIS